MNTLPKWLNPSRKAYLARLMLEYTTIGGWQVDLLTSEVYHPDYEARIAPLIEDWQSDDREQAKLNWQLEQRYMHSLGEPRLPVRGRFNNISRDIFHDIQPLFYFEGLGLDAIRLLPFAKVKLSSSYLRLYVNLGDSLRGVSKHQKRKAIRYGKALPKTIEQAIQLSVSLAIRDYLNH